MTDLLSTVERYLAELNFELERKSPEAVYRLLQRPDEQGRRRAVYVHVADDPGLVHVWAPVLQAVGPDPEGALLRVNAELPFGKLCWYPTQAAVTLDATLVGADLTRRQLDQALGLVALLSRRVADELQGEIGGEIPEVLG